MSEQWSRRIDERDKGRRRLRRLTGWSAAAGVALSALFGVAFAHHDQAAKAPELPNQLTNSPGSTGSTPTMTGSNGRTGIQPPPQPPTTTPSRGHTTSGGS